MGQRVTSKAREQARERKAREWKAREQKARKQKAREQQAKNQAKKRKREEEQQAKNDKKLVGFTLETTGVEPVTSVANGGKSEQDAPTTQPYTPIVPGSVQPGRTALRCAHPACKQRWVYHDELAEGLLPPGFQCFQRNYAFSCKNCAGWESQHMLPRTKKPVSLESRVGVETLQLIKPYKYRAAEDAMLCIMAMTPEQRQSTCKSQGSEEITEFDIKEFCKHYWGTMMFGWEYKTTANYTAEQVRNACKLGPELKKRSQAVHADGEISFVHVTERSAWKLVDTSTRQPCGWPVRPPAAAASANAVSMNTEAKIPAAAGVAPGFFSRDANKKQCLETESTPIRQMGPPTGTAATSPPSTEVVATAMAIETAPVEDDWGFVRKAACVDHGAAANRIGRGGNCIGVYKLTRPSDGKHFAVKLTHASPGTVQEVKMSMSLVHPRICRLHTVKTEKADDKGSLRTFTLLVFDYCEGGDLQTRLEKLRDTGGDMSEDEARRVFKQVLEGLAYAHSQGVAHRDLTLGNVLLSDDGSVKISDFGWAKNVQATHGYSSTAAGTPTYHAPEMISMENRRRFNFYAVDVWSAGVVLWASIFKSFPFRTPAQITARQFQAVRRVVSEPLKELLLMMLTVDPEKRLATAKVGNLLHHPWVCGA